MNTTRLRLAAAACLAAGAFLAACDNDNSDDDDTATAASGGSATTTETETADETPQSAEASASAGGGDGGEEGSVTVTADGDTYTLGVDECMLSDSGPLVVVATNSDENASFSAAGIAGTVTAEFNLDGEQWIAVGAAVDVDGATMTYDGTALKTGANPPDADLAFEVDCS